MKECFPIPFCKRRITMAEDTVSKFLAILAILIAVVAIGLTITAQPVQQVGIQGAFDPNMQPSILQMKEPMSNSNSPFVGVVFTNQRVNVSGLTTSYVGQLVYRNDTYWLRADPSVPAYMEGRLGMVVKKPTSNSTYDAQILIRGLVYNSSWTLTKGIPYYANSTTPGSFSSVRPNSNDLAAQVIGYGYNTTVLYFDPVYNMTANAL